jgi:hypothetical protein
MAHFVAPYVGLRRQICIAGNPISRRLRLVFSLKRRRLHRRREVRITMRRYLWISEIGKMEHFEGLDF